MYTGQVFYANPQTRTFTMTTTVSLADLGCSWAKVPAVVLVSGVPSEYNQLKWYFFVAGCGAFNAVLRVRLSFTLTKAVTAL